MYMDDHNGFHYVVKDCLQWEISHYAVFTTQIASYENIRNIVHLDSIVELGPTSFVDYCIVKISAMFSIKILQPSLAFESNNLDFCFQDL